jgi:hypothetical protein
MEEEERMDEQERRSNSHIFICVILVVRATIVGEKGRSPPN